MKYFFLFFFIYTGSFGQILPGTLEVYGVPTFIQSFEEIVKEAGEDDGLYGYERLNASSINFTLNANALQSSIELCETNIFRYSVYVHTNNSPLELGLEIKTDPNGGNRYPLTSGYDSLEMIETPLGPRDLYPAMGGSYIAVPNNAANAVKIMEFVGCRTDIPLHFQFKPSIMLNENSFDFDICITVVASET